MVENEFVRNFNLESTKKSGSKLILEATTDECTLLAKRFSIPDITSLIAKIQIKRQSTNRFGDYIVDVELNAEIIQTCVMTLNDINETIKESFKVIYAKNSEEENSTTEVDFNVDDDDIEFFSSPDVDLGELVAEYLSLAMQSYPRQEDVQGDELGVKIMSEQEQEKHQEKKNPFNVLESLKH